MSEVKKRLGRGLDSLISSTRLTQLEAEPVGSPSPVPIQNEVIHHPSKNPSVPPHHHPSGDSLQEISLDAITKNPHQPRIHWDEAKLEELAASIKANGLIQPILVRTSGQGYQIIAGERRYKAAQIAGMKSIPAIVRHADEEKMMEWALIENIHRSDLNAIERAKAYRSYTTRFQLTQQQAAERIGEDRATLANYMRLLELPEEIQQMVGQSKISMGHARALLGVTDHAARKRLAQEIIDKNLSVRQLEKTIQQFHKKQNEIPLSALATGRQAHLRELETEFSRHLGIRVQIRPTGKRGHRGKIILEYFSLDDFDRLREIFVK